jgi:hypothetical protein
MSDAMPNHFKVIKGDDGRWKVEDLGHEEAFFGNKFATKDEAIDAFRKHLAGEGRSMSVLHHRDGWSEVITRPQAKSTVTLTLTVWPELNDLLDNLADELGVTKGDAVVKAINLLKIAVDARKAGQKLLVVDDATGEEEEITGI